MRKALLRLTRECGETGGGPDCPVLEALVGHLRLKTKKAKP